MHYHSPHRPPCIVALVTVCLLSRHVLLLCVRVWLQELGATVKHSLVDLLSRSPTGATHGTPPPRPADFVDASDALLQGAFRLSLPALLRVCRMFERS